MIFSVPKSFDRTVTPHNVTLALKGLSLHWREIGQLLHIPKEVLQQIEDEFKDNHSQALYEVIFYWIWSNDECSWSTIKSMVIGLKRKDYLQVIDSHMERFKSEVNSDENLPHPISYYEDSRNRKMINESHLLHIIEIIQQFPTKWIDIGTKLGVPKWRMNIIKQRYPQLEDQSLQMIYTWHQENKSTWQDLIDALKKVECHSAAGEVRQLAEKQLHSTAEHMDVIVEPVETPDWKERESDRHQAKSHITSKKEETDKLKKSTLLEIRTLLQVEDQVSDEDILKNLGTHIKNATGLDKQKAKNLDMLIQSLAQHKQEYSQEIRLQAKKLQEALETTSNIRAKLLQNKQNLESTQTKLNKQREGLQNRFQSFSKQKSHYHKCKLLNEVLHEAWKTDKKLENIKSVIQQLEHDLGFANADHAAISDRLNDCISELEDCVEASKEYQITIEEFSREISTLWPTLKAGGIGAAVGGAIGGAAGAIGGALGGPLGMALAGAIGFGVGTFTGGAIGAAASAISRTVTRVPDDEPAIKCREMVGPLAKEQEDIRNELKKLKKEKKKKPQDKH